MKKIYCDSNPRDFLVVSVSCGYAYIDAQAGGKITEIELSPNKIRKLRKQLKRALIEIEGEKAEDTTPRNWFSEGKIVRVTNNLSLHGFWIGDMVRVVDIEGGIAKAEYPDGSDFSLLREAECEPA